MLRTLSLQWELQQKEMLTTTALILTCLNTNTVESVRQPLPMYYDFKMEQPISVTIHIAHFPWHV